MNLKYVTAAAALAVAMLGFAAPPVSAQNAEGVAAIVNDKVISTFDVRQRATMLLLFANLQPTPETRTHNGKRQMKMTHEGLRGDLHWVVAGGESGPGARPMHPDWVRSLRDQCAAARVPFFFKQWGEFSPGTLDPQPTDPEPWRVHPNGRRVWDVSESLTPRDTWPAVTYTRVGKNAAGRMLDGRTHDEYPA